MMIIVVLMMIMLVMIVIPSHGDKIKDIKEIITSIFLVMTQLLI